jgi:DNA-binding NarL/FixJ family response regulator
VAGRRAQILVVDDDPTFCRFVEEALEDAGMGVLLADGADSATAIARENHTDATVLDVGLPGINGYGLCRQLREIYGPELPVVFVSGTQTGAKERATGILVGGDDYLVKPVDPDELVARLRRLLERARTWSKPPTSDLTTREIEVLQLVAEGYPPAQVATELVISPKTVSSHVQRILVKLNAHTRAQAVAIAYEAGLIRLPGNSLGSNLEVDGHVMNGTPVVQDDVARVASTS